VSSAGFRQVGSANEFASATDSIWFRAGDRLHVKFTIPATDVKWHGSRMVTIVNQ
jgi:hypothetical protein